MNVWLLIAIGWLAAAVLMSALWGLQRWTGHSSIADVGWSFGVGVLSLFFAVASTDGDSTRRTCIAILALLWAARLGGYLLVRILTMPEDGRYLTLKDNYGAKADQRLFMFFQYQAGGIVLFSLPMLAAARSPAAWGVYDYLGVAVWTFAMLGEILADYQLNQFRANPANKGKVCRDGLWYFSRHPNYFFEWLHWWAYVLLAISTPWWLLAMVGPLAMLYFLVSVTGIPLAEEQALKSRGDAYREYQKVTSVFVPWPPKSASLE